MKAFITGITGFAGQHLAALLIKRGYEVFGIARKIKEVKGVTIKNISVTDKETLKKFLADVKPDIIFHLASLSSVKACRDDPELAKAVNVIGTQNVILSCIELGINSKILITSSAHVYGIPNEVPIRENHPLQPVNEYGKSKLEQEKMAMDLFKQYGTYIIIARSFNHIGPNQDIGFVCSDFAKQIVDIENGSKFPEIKVGDLSSKRDFSDVRDIVRAYLLLIEKGISGNIYNVGSGECYTMRAILNMLVSKSNIEISVVEDADLFRKSDIPILLADNSKLKEVTGWMPQFTIEQSLTDVLNYWRKTSE